MREHAGDVLVQEQAGGALWGIAAAHISGLRLVVGSDGLRALVEAMRGHPSQIAVHEQACTAIPLLAHAQDPEQRILVVTTGR